MELDSDTRDLDIQLYNESERLYICDNKIYDSNSIFKNLKTELHLKKQTQKIYLLLLINLMQ